MKLLVTGAAGYIGGTFCYEALSKGYEVIGIDNFSNSEDKIINYFLRNYPNQFEFIELNLLNQKKLNSILGLQKNIDCVLHFAALKSVPESEEKSDKKESPKKGKMPPGLAKYHAEKKGKVQESLNRKIRVTIKK